MAAAAAAAQMHQHKTAVGFCRYLETAELQEPHPTVTAAVGAAEMLSVQEDYLLPFHLRTQNR